MIDKSMKETNKSKVKHVTFKEDYDEKDEYTWSYNGFSRERTWCTKKTKWIGKKLKMIEERIANVEATIISKEEEKFEKKQENLND